MTNREIADRLDAFATLLELGEANPYTTRAYRRAGGHDPGHPGGRLRAGPVRPGPRAPRDRVRHRDAAARARRDRVDRGARRARTEALSRARRSGPLPRAHPRGRRPRIARALDIRTAEEFRSAAAEGRLRSVPGVGPKLEARLLDALARGSDDQLRPSPLLDRARELTGAVAAALDAAPAGDARRWCESCERLAVVSRAAEPEPVHARFAALPQIVAVLDRGTRRATGVTVEGVPIELIVAEPEQFGTELVRATGVETATSRRSSRCPRRRMRPPSIARSGCTWCPPELREDPGAVAPDTLVELEQIRGDLHSHTTWSDGRASVEEMGRAAAGRGYEYLAICDHTPAVGAVRRLTPDDVRRQGQEIAAANERLAPFRVLRGIECDILPDGRLDLPDYVLAELDWVQVSVHGGQRMPEREMTKRVEEALLHPHASCLSHPTGRYVTRRPENALDLDRVYALAVELGIAIEVNGLPARLDLSGRHVRDALRAGVEIVCSTDAHSTDGLGNMMYAVATARRGGAGPSHVLNTRPLEAILTR